MDQNSKGGIGAGVAVVIALLAFAVSAWTGASKNAPVSQPASQEQTVGGERAGLQEYVDGVKAGTIPSKWVSATMPVGASSVALYTNRTGRDVYADFGSVDIPTGSTASTTQMVSIVATSSSATTMPTWADFGTLREGNKALIQSFPLATSTAATSTNSIMAATLVKGMGSIVIPDGFTLFGFMQQTFANQCTGATCETSTSSNRGFNPQFKVRLTTYGNSF